MCNKQGDCKHNWGSVLKKILYYNASLHYDAVLPAGLSQGATVKGQLLTAVERDCLVAKLLN